MPKSFEWRRRLARLSGIQSSGTRIDCRTLCIQNLAWAWISRGIFLGNIPWNII